MIKLSASSAKLLKQCERAYYIKTKLKIPIDWQPPWLDFGCRVHKVIETGEKDENPEINACAASYNNDFPDKPDFCEVRFDCEDSTGALDAIFLRPDNTAIIVDIKTCSKWTARELTDYQANLYISVWPSIQKQLGITHRLTHFEWREIRKKDYKTKVTSYAVEEFQGIRHDLTVQLAEAIIENDEIPEPNFEFSCKFCLWKDTCQKLLTETTHWLDRI